MMYITSKISIKIISGGQTGADQGGLRAAKRLGIKTGGTAADEYMTESGKAAFLKRLYNLVDYGFSYEKRTLHNIMSSNGTAIFSDHLDSSGTKLTLEKCKHFKKPYIVNPTPEELFKWVVDNNISILNIAGNRESLAPGIGDRTEEIVYNAFLGKV